MSLLSQRVGRNLFSNSTPPIQKQNPNFLSSYLTTGITLSSIAQNSRDSISLQELQGQQHGEDGAADGGAGEQPSQRGGGTAS